MIDTAGGSVARRGAGSPICGAGSPICGAGSPIRGGSSVGSALICSGSSDRPDSAGMDNPPLHVEDVSVSAGATTAA